MRSQKWPNAIIRHQFNYILSGHETYKFLCVQSCLLDNKDYPFRKKGGSGRVHSLGLYQPVKTCSMQRSPIHLRCDASVHLRHLPCIVLTSWDLQSYACFVSCSLSDSSRGCVGPAALYYGTPERAAGRACKREESAQQPPCSAQAKGGCIAALTTQSSPSTSLHVC